MKYIVYAMAAMFFLASCSKDNDETGGGNGGGGETGGVTDVTPVTSDLTVNLTTDKACYKPGETVSFTAGSKGTLPYFEQGNLRTGSRRQFLDVDCPCNGFHRISGGCLSH